MMAGDYSIAKAVALVSGMLASGSRGAAEIIAAGQGDINERTIQRASRRLGVVKTKDGHGGWSWRLPEVTEAPPVSAAPAVDQRQRAQVIAARLRKLEAGRGKLAPIHAGDPRLLRWVLAGISDPDLREAYELAVAQRVEDGDATAINAGFLDRFVAKLTCDNEIASGSAIGV